METKDKELLLKDLCARLPHGVKLWVKTEEIPVELTRIDIENSEVKFYSCKLPLLTVLKISKIERFDKQIIKPYLRLMSDMTEEEMKEYQAFFYYDGVEYPEEYIDWLNEHHFDYRGLIEKGLALVAPKGMYGN